MSLLLKSLDTQSAFCNVFDVVISHWICSNVISMVPFTNPAFFCHIFVYMAIFFTLDPLLLCNFCSET